MPEEKEVPEHFGDLENRAGLDLFHVLAIAAIPGRLVDLDVAFFQDRIDFIDFFSRNDFAKPYRARVVGGNHDRHLVVDHLKDVELLFFAAYVTLVDTLYNGNAMRWINCVVAYFEHAFRTSSS